MWAFLLSLVLPDGTPNDQILSRTAPDVRALGIALLAGGAGAYGYVHDELSGLLPGVAVALVPPLVVVGRMLELGTVALALGALTLFAANLVDVAFAARLVILVAWPLGQAYRAEARAARTMTRAQSIAQQEAAVGTTV